MKFIVDECTGPAVARWLRQQGHDVFSVYDQARGIADDEVMQMAFAERRILVTNDKDFGARVYRDRRSHHGVILLRLEDERAASKMAVLSHLLTQYSDKVDKEFAVVSERRVRFAKQR